MKFDVVVGNPPYQESDGGAGASAKPLYNLFTEFAIKKLNSEQVCLITPSKWFAGGKGLDGFRDFMLNDSHLKVLSDFINSKDVFAGVSIGGGVNFFLHDNTYVGDCEIINHYDNITDSSMRPLNEFPVFVRYNRGVSILHKVLGTSDKFVSEYVTARNPFGFSSKYRGQPEYFDGSVKLLTSAGDQYVDKSEVKSGTDLVDKYKVVISKVTAEHAGEPDKNGLFKIISSNRIMSPNSVCTDSYLVIFHSKNAIEATSYLKYLKTKFYRTLLMLSVSSITLSADKFKFIPQQDFTAASTINWSRSISDINQQLYVKYGLNEDEIQFIEDKIKEMS
ncbi:Eco57I restriction-modification methylase domain-containing protein [Schleiferilactobacillus harbinensis]|uniref:Eco57I restriction-modification methylase domain-containing protein n=1 Tax=Schleiferilactobacillus harbinensis TaxID=304207 RepID=UPI00345E9D5B